MSIYFLLFCGGLQHTSELRHCYYHYLMIIYVSVFIDCCSAANCSTLASCDTARHGRHGGGSLCYLISICAFIIYYLFIYYYYVFIYYYSAADCSTLASCDTVIIIILFLLILLLLYS
ncbi:hypothetical protein T492DRAFT_939931 [Pavlovales sp. CCMP2436]|nr:hypothetical protein T492DRAFT_939931 [Pavlovales sp. CCMP2436]